MNQDKRTKEDKKRDILKCIKSFNDMHGYSPTVREICRMTRIKSTGSVQSYVNELKAERLITMDNQTARTMKVQSLEQKNGKTLIDAGSYKMILRLLEDSRDNYESIAENSTDEIKEKFEMKAKSYDVVLKQFKKNFSYMRG